MSPTETKKKIGIFGGSFDPIHHGHLLLAELCRESLGLDQIRFLLANVSPFKTENPPTSNKDRIEMVQLAIGGNPAFEIDTREIDRGGVSYTIDSVREMISENIGSDYFLLMGADSLVDISKWREPAALFQLVTPCVIARGGVGEPNWTELLPYLSEEKASRLASFQVTTPQIEISSADLRSRLERGGSIRYQVPPAVEMFIREHGTYGVR